MNDFHCYFALASWKHSYCSYTISQITAVIKGSTIVSRIYLGNPGADFNLLENNPTPNRCKDASLGMLAAILASVRTK